MDTVDGVFGCSTGRSSSFNNNNNEKSRERRPSLALHSRFLNSQMPYLPSRRRNRPFFAPVVLEA